MSTDYGKPIHLTHSRYLPFSHAKPKVTCMDTCRHDNGALFNLTIQRKIVRDIVDAGHVLFAEYVTSGEVSHLNDAVEYFQLVLDQCLVAHPDCGEHLLSTNLARCIQEDIEGDVFVIISRNALASRPKGHLIIHYHSLTGRLPGAVTGKILPPIYARSRLTMVAGLLIQDFAG
ncbi:hypothetical protein BDR07DRAFT_481565 [Suillus spraguei]|nr:hypothetical protein BDR07DRAFT_481565 [Suillus spraguei]